MRIFPIRIPLQHALNAFSMLSPLQHHKSISLTKKAFQIGLMHERVVKISYQLS